MTVAKQHAGRLSKPFQWVATLLAVTVIALGTLAARPDWHAAVHDQLGDAAHHDHGHSPEGPTDESGCAIQMFASGLVDSVAFASLPIAPTREVVAVRILPDERPSLASTFLEPPGRAPPSAS